MINEHGLLITRNLRGIYTTKGIVYPFLNFDILYEIKRHAVIIGKLLDENSIARDIWENMYISSDNSPDFLREFTSYNIFKDREVIFSKEEFVYNLWNFDNYTISDISDFFIKISDIVYKNNDLYIETKDEEMSIIVIGYTNTVYKTLNKKSINTLTDGYEIFKYFAKNQEEFEFLKKHVKPEVSMAIVHALYIAKKYKENNIEPYDFFQKKTPTKVRDIYAPKEDVKKALRHLLIPLNTAYDMRNKYSNQFAYTIKRGIKNNANVHKNYKYTLKADITSFFDYCSWDMVEKYLEFLFPYNISSSEKDLLKTLIINPKTNGLYQGSPVSGPLSNAIMRPAAIYMNHMFNKMGFVFSIYADDITVSSNEPITNSIKNKIIGRIRYAFEFYKLPFILKNSKTQVVSNNGRKITGVRINHLDQLTIERKKYKEIRHILYNMSKGKECPINKSTLKGRIGFYSYIDESNKFRRLFIKYEQMLLENGIDISPFIKEGQISIDDIHAISELEYQGDLEGNIFDIPNYFE